MTARTPRGKAKAPAQKQGYHHADLRRALLDAAILHLRTGDVTALTMQSLARAAGVSPGAPYHHFPDKVSVLAALATEGYEIWFERAVLAVSEITAPKEALAALARGWLRFAVTFPSHYRVMFLPDVGDRSRFSGLHDTSGRGLEMLVALVAAAWPKLSAAEASARAIALWSTLHGFASLRNGGVIENIPGLPSLAALEAELVALVLSPPD